MVNMGDLELGVSGGDADVSSVILNLFLPLVYGSGLS